MNSFISSSFTYPLMFWNTPEELKGKPNYYLSDDDRVFWWDGSEEVVLSKDMNKWLTDISVRHKQLLKDIPPDYDKENFLKKLILALAKIEAYYKRVYAFQNMFYDFLQHGADKRYFAAVLLMEELAEENKEAGKIIEKAVNWDSANKNVRNRSEITLKELFLVPANCEAICRNC